MVSGQLYLLQPYFLTDEVWVHCAATKTQPSCVNTWRGLGGEVSRCISAFSFLTALRILLTDFGNTKLLGSTSLPWEEACGAFP